MYRLPTHLQKYVGQKSGRKSTAVGLEIFNATNV